jgi:negative regulator of flagellin synthesis FlgM
MKIGSPADKPVPVTPGSAPAVAAESAAKAASTAAPGGVADPSAHVALSSAATLLFGASTPEFDTEKVAKISQAITDGTFTVNPEVIADKLIANAQELLSKVPR